MNFILHRKYLKIQKKIFKKKSKIKNQNSFSFFFSKNHVFFAIL